MAILNAVSGTAGTLEFGENTAMTCDFSIRQTTHAGLRVTCHVGTEHALRLSADNASVPQRLIGTTQSGRDIVVEGVFQFTRSAGEAVTYVCSGPQPVRIGRMFTGSARLICSLTNCFFPGSDVIEFSNGWYLGAMNLDLGGRVVRLEQRRRADSIRRQLRQAGDSAVTARALTNVTDEADREQALKVIDRVALLVSLASGTLVSRVRWQQRAADGTLVASVIGSPPQRPYTPRELLPPHDGAAFKRFIETADGTYERLDAAYQFAKVIHAKIDTAASGFLETRTLTASALIEYLAGVYARENGLTPPLCKDLFRDALPALIDQIDGLLVATFAEQLRSDDRQEMAARAQWFNEPTFGRKLRFLVQGLRLPFCEEDLRAIRETRNALVHRMRFHGKERQSPRVEWARMVHFIDLVLLRLLGYRGPYVDCRTWTIGNLD